MTMTLKNVRKASKYSTHFANATLDEHGVAVHSGWLVAYCTHPITREYLCATMEFLCIGAQLPDFSYQDKPVLPDDNMALIRSRDGERWEIVADFRGQVGYRISDGSKIYIDFLAELPASLTLRAPLKATDIWNGERWIDNVLLVPVASLAKYNLPMLL